MGPFFFDRYSTIYIGRSIDFRCQTCVEGRTFPGDPDTKFKKDLFTEFVERVQVLLVEEVAALGRPPPRLAMPCRRPAAPSPWLHGYTRQQQDCSFITDSEQVIHLFLWRGPAAELAGCRAAPPGLADSPTGCHTAASCSYALTPPSLSGGSARPLTHIVRPE